MSDCYETLLKLTQNLSTKERIHVINEYLETHSQCETEFTLQEIADLFGMTKERIRQIEISAIKKLRHPKLYRRFKELLDQN